MRQQLHKGDQLIMVADAAGDFNAAQEVWFDTRTMATKTWAVTPPNIERNGYAQRELGMTVAGSTHLAFLDDDDIYTDGALDLMREHATDVPVIFKMEYGSDKYASKKGDQLWRDETLEFGNVGSPMFLVPNVPEKLGRWKAAVKIQFKHAVGGDFTFIRQSVEQMGGVVWRPEVVAIVRPNPSEPYTSIS